MAKNKKASGGKKKNNKNSSVGNEQQQKQLHQGTASESHHGEGGDFLYIDPARIRFQHSRIRPYFSGCGRSVVGTLESIRRGEITPGHLPPIQVIVGPTDGPSANSNDKSEDARGPWYFSLNNRRLWVLKRCREEELLQSSNNLIRVRVRAPKSAAERDRYSLEKCALEAKIVPEKTSKKIDKTIKKEDNNDSCDEETPHVLTTGAGISNSADDVLALSSERTEEVVMKGAGPVKKKDIGSGQDEEDDDSRSSSSSGSSSSVGFASTNPFSLLS